jgi:hypothetical protein
MSNNKLIITPTQARRLAITRQRLAGPRPKPTPDGIMELFASLGCVQIDPIRAVERTQFLVLWSRLGNYPVAHLDTLLWAEKRLFEYWAHAASIVLTDDFPIHYTYMHQYANGHFQSDWYNFKREWVADNEAFRQYILDRLRTEGAVTSAQLEDRAEREWGSTGWTNRQNVSQMLSYLWTKGEIMVTSRRGLHKKWALAEEHFPAWTPRHRLTETEMVRQAAQKSLRALGVGTAKHIANHFTRDRYPNLEAVLVDLTTEQRLLPVTIAAADEIWPGNWFIHAEDVPLLSHLGDEVWQPCTVLLSPFDNLICDRDRTELMWDFYFRIEIYVPQAKRQYGYYVLPILHGDRLIGRIDPKMDRKTGILRINALYFEPEVEVDASIRQAVSQTISELGQFLGAKDIHYAQPEWPA